MQLSDDQLQEFNSALSSAKSYADLMGKNGVIKKLLGQAINGLLEAEMEEHLGYEKHSISGNNSGNNRNGYKSKTLKTDQGDLEIKVPQDRESSFTPALVPKHSRRLGTIEDSVMSLYTKGLSTRDIQDHLHEIYGTRLSPTTISEITNKVHEQVQGWQDRALKPCYPIIFLDAIHYRVKENNAYKMKAAYSCFAIDCDGKRDVLGIWVGESESARYWTTILAELKNRGVEEILIACVDGLTGFDNAIEAIYPKALIQKCVVHQIRNAFKFLTLKDRRPFLADLKEVYAASTLIGAEKAFQSLKDKWGKRYSPIIASWERNWHYLTTFFQFSPALRKIMYTTNSIENLHRQFRKVTKTKNVFPSDDSLRKSLYLAQSALTDKWIGTVNDWVSIRAELINHFEERFEKYTV